MVRAEKHARLQNDKRLATTAAGILPRFTAMSNKNHVAGQLFLWIAQKVQTQRGASHQENP
jgi:hypothetical protein